MSTRQDKPSSELEALHTISGALYHQFGAYQAVEAALAAPTLRAAGQPGRSTDTPDPVHQIVVSMSDYDETCALITEALGLVRIIQSRYNRVRQHHPDIARDADATIKASRCTGKVDATCTANWVVSPNEDNKYAGLCWKCIKRLQRAEQAATG